MSHALAKDAKRIRARTAPSSRTGCQIANVYWHVAPGDEVSPCVGPRIGVSRYFIDYLARW